MSPFYAAVYDFVRRVPAGKVTTYGDVARECGFPRRARQVGYALHVNPDPEHIPCFRVVNREGRLSSAFAFGGENMQKILLEREGASVVRREGEWYVADFEERRFRP